MPSLKAKRKGYVSMDREFLIRKDLSLKAKGLLAHMMTLPDNWRFTVDGLVHCHKESKTAITAAIKELEQLGATEFFDISTNGSLSKLSRVGRKCKIYTFDDIFS